MEEHEESGKITAEARRRLTDLQRHGLAALAIAAVLALQALAAWLSLTLLVFAGAFAVLGGVILLLKRRKRGEDDLRSVELDDAGIVGMNFAGKKIDFGWSELSVVRSSRAPKSGRGTLEFEGRGLRAVARQEDFPEIAMLRSVIEKRCNEKRVKWEEQNLEDDEGSPSKIMDAKVLIHDEASFDPRSLFRWVMYGGYFVLVVAMLIGWGGLEGAIAATVIWAGMAAAWICVPGVLPTKWLKTIHVTEAGVSGETFRGKKIEIPWEEVVNVIVRQPPGAQTSWERRLGRIDINGKKGRMTIGLQFPRFGSIVVYVSKACGEKNVRLFTVKYDAPSDGTSAVPNAKEPTEAGE